MAMTASAIEKILANGGEVTSACVAARIGLTENTTAMYLKRIGMEFDYSSKTWRHKQ